MWQKPWQIKSLKARLQGYTPPENQVEYSQLLERYKEEIKLWKQFVEAKDESFNKLSKEKDERIKEKDKTIDSLDGKIAELIKEKMGQAARISVVFDNRLLLEIGLRELFPKEKSMTAGYKKFVKSYLKSPDGKHLSDEARAAFKTLGIQEDERTIFHTCEGFYQSLSLPFHTKIPDISGTGYMVGGEHPFVAVCIVILRNLCKIRDVVAFADRSFRTINVCVEGNVVFVTTKEVEPSFKRKQSWKCENSATSMELDAVRQFVLVLPDDSSTHRDQP